jgi:hypothetical protein
MHGHCDILQQHMTDMFFCLNAGYPQSTSEKLEKISSTGFPISWEGAGSFPKRCCLERLGRNQKPSKSYSSSDPGSKFYAKFGRTYCRHSVDPLFVPLKIVSYQIMSGLLPLLLRYLEGLGTSITFFQPTSRNWSHRFGCEQPQSESQLRCQETLRQASKDD